MQLAREQGVRGVCAHALAVAGYRRVIVFERSLSSLPPPLELPPGARFERLDAAAIGAYLALRTDSTAALVQRRLAAGVLGHAIRLGDRLICVGWAAGGRALVGYLGADVDFPSGVAYHHDLYSDPAWRSRGIATMLVSHQLRALAAAGFARIHGAAVPENRASIRVYLKLGFRPLEWLISLRIGRRRRVIRRPWRGSAAALEAFIAPRRGAPAAGR